MDRRLPVTCVAAKRRNGPAESRTKRSLDMLGALSLLLFLSPLLVLVALLVRLDSPGGALFRQRRVGFAGRTFTIYKFRTMRVTQDSGWMDHAVRNDARVTRLGAFLRRSSLDELPQLYNVLIGDMSLVGPRPHALAHDAYYSEIIPGYMTRWRARPGLTGLAQVNGHRGEIRTAACMAKRVAADRDYIEQWSIKIDIIIALRTISLIWRDHNAY